VVKDFRPSGYGQVDAIVVRACVNDDNFVDTIGQSLKAPGKELRFVTNYESGCDSSFTRTR
jgi:hypothetical protein